MDKSEFDHGLLKSKKDVKSTAASFASSMKGLAMGGLAAVGVGGFGALTSSAMELGSELQTLAQLSGASIEEIQRLGAASKTVGIDTAGLADIYKDVGDKIGDFLQTGAGPMADFFENIAPRVGVTAEMFRELSGPDALQLYHDSLVKANVSQNEMKFFMEAIASESTRLIPLLADGGEGFKTLGDEAVIMSEKTAKSLKEAQGHLATFGRTLTIIAGTSIGNAMDVFADTDEDISLSASALKDLGGAVKSLFDTLIGAKHGDAADRVADRLMGVSRATEAQVDSAADGVGALEEKYVELFDTINEGAEGSANNLAEMSIKAQDEAAEASKLFALSTDQEKLKSLNSQLTGITGEILSGGGTEGKLKERERLLDKVSRLEVSMARDAERTAKIAASAAETEHKRDLERVDEKTAKVAQASKQSALRISASSDLVNVQKTERGEIITRREGKFVVTTERGKSSSTSTRSLSPEAAILEGLDSKFAAMETELKAQRTQLEAINNNGAALIGAKGTNSNA